MYCPHCAGSSIKELPTSNNKTLYLCKDCGRFIIPVDDKPKKTKRIRKGKSK